jgi:hypothetical protein
MRAHDDPSFRIFINYRRDDTGSSALLLYDRLARRFGEDRVFLDVKSIKPGMRWLEEIKAAAGHGVLLALIGDRWRTILKERAGTDDYVRDEIELALKRGSSVEVIPLLIGDAPPPSEEHLPRSLTPIAGLQVHRIRHDTTDPDMDALLARLDVLAARPVPPPPPPVIIETPRRPRFERAVAPLVPAPGEAHHDRVLQYLLEGGTVVPVLGPGANESDSPPDARGLATNLASGVDVSTCGLSSDLAEVAQYVYTTQGEPDLYRRLKQLLTVDYAPGPVHRFLASVPRLLEELGAPRRHQMIVTTNFDTALEQAFDEAEEPYDLAVYMASGSDRGKFVHFPYESEPEPIFRPNCYGELPIGDDGEIERTLIVKIHGAVDGDISGYSWKQNYVVTEDHYINYLSRSPVETLVPTQILDTLRAGHCLFLGYTMRDWRMRVFLQRIWLGEQLAAKSWAIQSAPDILEKEFWGRSNVELFDTRLADYVAQFEEHLATLKPAET